jgi:tRNA dimethylallyltransferase
VAAARVIAIVGPTASGKSALALSLARERKGEIVSCDSLQVYRGLDIGSAKPTVEQRRAVPHHLIDVVDPDQDFSAADYARLARAALAQIGARGGQPIVAGGTGLYLRALRRGLFEGPSRDPELRRRLERMAQRHGDARLHRLLAHVDPEAAARIEPGDRVRVVRALEVYQATGRPLTDHHRAGTPALEGHEWLVVGLNPPRDALLRAVEARTRAMMEAGLVDETRALLARYPAPPRPLRAIGYRQAAAVVRGEQTVDQAQRDIVKETMRYAKRQMTWFRHQEDVRWCAGLEEAQREVEAWLGLRPRHDGTES